MIRVTAAYLCKAENRMGFGEIDFSEIQGNIFECVEVKLERS